MVKEIDQLRRLYDNFEKFHRISVPLCAAENVMSDFVKEPLAKDFQERYIMGSAYEYSMDDNFIGSEYLFPYYKMIDVTWQGAFPCKIYRCQNVNRNECRQYINKCTCKTE